MTPFRTLFILSILTFSLPASAQSFTVDFTPAEFLNWCLTPGDFDKRIVKSDDWKFEVEKPGVEKGSVMRFYTFNKNEFVSIGAYTYRSGGRFYVLNLPDGGWVLQLMNQLMNMQKANLIILQFNPEKNSFLATGNNMELEISFTEALFVVYVNYAQPGD